MTDTPNPAPLLADLAAIVGARHVLTGRGDMAPYLVEHRGLYHGLARAVVRPGGVGEVAAILALANARGAAIVPQGGNTGLVGGQVPDATGTEIVLSLTRLDRVREIDSVTDTMTVDAGVTLLRARAAAEAADRLFPLWLPSEGSCTIGGNLSTNAGGATTLAYGNARELVLGVEVALADGRVMNLLNKLRKDNTGYDLRNLFIGAEGTLGVITGAVLRLFPRPRSVATGFAAVGGPQAAIDLLGLAKGRVGPGVTAFELFPRFAVDIVLAHIPGTREPLSGRHAWYVLIELSLQEPDSAPPLLEALLADGMERGLVVDAAIAASLEHRQAFWRLRETVSEAQKPVGGSIKHDVSVPIAGIPAFIADADSEIQKVAPGCRPFAFGHVGDGNIHYNVFQPEHADKAAFLAGWKAMQDAVHGVALAHGGSFSAEHGIGVQKREMLAKAKDPVALGLMRDLKRLLDPKGILNPGKVV